MFGRSECFTPATGSYAKRGRFNHPLMCERVFPGSSLTSHRAAGEIPLVSVDERQRGDDAGGSPAQPAAGRSGSELLAQTAHVPHKHRWRVCSITTLYRLGPDFDHIQDTLIHVHRETWIFTLIRDRHQDLSFLSVQLPMRFFLCPATQTAEIFKSEKDKTTVACRQNAVKCHHPAAATTQSSHFEQQEQRATADSKPATTFGCCQAVGGQRVKICSGGLLLLRSFMTIIFNISSDTLLYVLSDYFRFLKTRGSSYLPKEMESISFFLDPPPH